MFRDSKKYDGNKQRKGIMEMISIEDMNSSHPFQILGSDDDMDMGDELDEEVEHAEEESRGEGDEGPRDDHATLLNSNQREKEREEALQFLGNDEEQFVHENEDKEVVRNPLSHEIDNEL